MIMVLTGFILSAIAVVVLDQVTKSLACAQEVRRGAPNRWPVAWIHCVANARPCLGLVRGRVSAMCLWTATRVGLSLGFSRDCIAARVNHYWEPVGLGAALGGATGNAFDYVRRGAIIDFIALRVWPVFNLSDVAIVMGISVAIWASV